MDPLSEAELFDEPTAPLASPIADETVPVFTLPTGAARPQLTARRVLCGSAGVAAALIATVAAGRIVRSGRTPAHHQLHTLTRQRHGARPVTSRTARGHRAKRRATVIIRHKSVARAPRRVRAVAPRSVANAPSESAQRPSSPGIVGNRRPNSPPSVGDKGQFAYLGR